MGAVAIRDRGCESCGRVVRFYRGIADLRDEPPPTCFTSALARTPEELARHNCLVTGDFTSNWEYKAPDGRPGTVRVSGRYCCDNWEVLREWALAGLGVALKSTWDVHRQLEDGSLVPLLPGYAFHSDVAIYAVYPHRRFLPAKTRVFIEFLAQSFGPEPYWDKGRGQELAAA